MILPKEMYAAMILSAGEIALRKVPLLPLNANEVLVRVAYCGISGTCLRSFRGTFPGTIYPVIPGLEITGTICALGSEVTNANIGQPVAIEPVITCGNCPACRVGRYNCCASLALLGVHTSGGISDYIAVPAAKAYPLPPNLPLLTASLCEAFSIGMQANSRGKISEQDTVVLIGCGVIGLTILLIARSRGARVLIIEPNSFRRATATGFGVDAVYSGEASTAKQAVMEFTNGEGASVVIDATGSPSAIAATTAFAAPASRIVIVGLTNEAVPISTLEIVRKELDIYGVRNCCGLFGDAIDFVASNKEIVLPLISQVFPLSNVGEAFRLVDRDTERLFRVVIEMPS